MYVPEPPLHPMHLRRGVTQEADSKFPQILKVVELESPDLVKRPYIKQLISKGLKFPLPHRVPKVPSRKIFTAKRPSTFA